MGKPGPATQAKRQRERNKQERREEKSAERAIRKEQKQLDTGSRGPDDEDPDLAGIVAGPHNAYNGEN